MLSKQVLNVSREELHSMTLDEGCLSFIHKHLNDENDGPSHMLMKLVLNRPTLLFNVSKFSIIPLDILLLEDASAVCELAVVGLHRLSIHSANRDIMKDVGIFQGLLRFLKSNTSGNSVRLIYALKILESFGLHGDVESKELLLPLLVNLLTHSEIDVRSVAMNLLCQLGYFKRN
jgi:hypothetical protein